VVGLEWMQARILFPMVLLFALWCVLAGVWPRKTRGTHSIPAHGPEAAGA
jgi:hypothetical protein